MGNNDLISILKKKNIKTVNVIHTNDIDVGSYISDTLKVDFSNHKLEALSEIHKVMRPGEPSTKEAAESLFRKLFFEKEKYDLSDVGRMKFNFRLRKKSFEGLGIL